MRYNELRMFVNMFASSLLCSVSFIILCMTVGYALRMFWSLGRHYYNVSFRILLHMSYLALSPWPFKIGGV